MAYSLGDAFHYKAGRPHNDTRGTVISNQPAGPEYPGQRLVCIQDERGCVRTLRINENGDIVNFNHHDE